MRFFYATLFCVQETGPYTGGIPEKYDRLLGPVLFEPFAVAGAERLPLGCRRVLEVAAGTGRATRHLLNRVATDGELLATDLSPDMIEWAASVLRDSRLRWRVADAQQLPVPDAWCDAVVCQFGLMFVPDQRLALREMRRVLAPGGRLVLATWDAMSKNPATEVLQQLVVAAASHGPPMFLDVPFSLHDAAALADMVSACGFPRVEVTTMSAIGRAPSATHLANAFVRGSPLWNQLVDRNVDVDQFTSEVTLALASRFGAEPCVAPMSAHILVADA